MDIPAPTGEQFELTAGDARCVVVAQGAGLRVLRLHGREVVDGYGRDEAVSSSRGALLLPWPNRVRDGRYTVGAVEHQLDLSEPARGHAIHGLTRFVTWQARERTTDSVRLGYELCASPGYPFHLELGAAYRLAEHGLTVKTTVHNRGADSAPVGMGAHPYVTLGEDCIDTAILRLPASQRLAVDERLIPTGVTLPVDATDYDFRQPRALGSFAMDTAFAGLERDSDGLARCYVETANGDHRVTLWLGEGLDHLMVFTGDGLGPRRRQGIALEPMSCPPDAYNSGVDLARLAPGERLDWSFGITADQGR